MKYVEITTADEYFELVLPRMAEEHPDLLEDVEVVAQWNIKGDPPSVWTTVVREGKLTCSKGPAGDPEIVVDMDRDVMLEIYRDEIKPTTAFMTKRLRLTGNIEKALKLAKLLQEEVER